MNRFLAAFCAALALSWCAPAAAAIGTPVNIGQAQQGASNVSALSVSTTADAPAGAAIIGMEGLSASATALIVKDSQNNAYTAEAQYIAAGVGTMWNFHADNPVDLPAPCTVTATETATTLVITALGTCPSGMTLGKGLVTTEAISGGSFTGSLAVNTPCALSSLPVTCTITGGATIGAGATATVSSTISTSWSTATARPALVVASVSGLAASSPRDVLGAGSVVGSPGTSSSISTGTLAQASEIVFAFNFFSNSVTSYTPGPGFTALTGVTISGSNGQLGWGYQIVSSTASVTSAASWTTSRSFGTNIYSFKAAGGVVVRPCLLNLLGVGSC